MRVALPQVAQFADSLARCVNADVRSAKCLELSAGIFPPGRARDALRRAKAELESGSTLAQALEPAAGYLPGFFIPVVACGEEAGRLVRALRFVADHCRRLSPVAQKLHNAWFYLAIIIGGTWLAGAVIRIVALGFFQGLGSSSNTVALVGVVAGIVYLTKRNPAVRRKVHAFSLALPFIERVQEEWAVVIFSTAMGLMYGAAVPARRMVEMAANGVPNLVLAERLRGAVLPLTEGRGFSQALATTQLFPAEYLAALAAAEETGELEETFCRLAEQTAEKLYNRLSAFSGIVHRIVAYVCGIYLALQIYGLAMVLSGRT